MAENAKKWGNREFWGLGSEYDPDWVLTEEQKKIRDDLMEICRTKIRPHAIHCDRTYEYPTQSLHAMAELGLLGLLVPKELGGLGQTNTCAAMVVETLARYGCPSTSLVYTMHLGATACLLLRYHKNPRIIDLLKRLDKEKLVGTLSYSDPATGGHYWFPLSSKTKMIDENTLKILKYASWTTSAGFADWYIIQTISPDFGGDFSNLSCFLVYKDEIRASTDDWSAMGMHGNQSGPMIVEGNFKLDRMVGPPGDGRKSNDECVDPYFLILTASAWNGISLACIDLAKKHVTRKAHADVGMRICDYPTIQDYFGDVVSSTSVCRGFVFLVAKGMDNATHNNDWSLHTDLDFLPRVDYLHWTWIAKKNAAQNVSEVSDTMLHACGGTGYKTELGLERLLRDSKASCVMGPSNEVLRQFVGQTSLFGIEIIDYWDQRCNERIVYHELKKLSLEDKKELAQKLLTEVQQEESGTKASHPYQDTDFENPFNTSPPHYSGKPLVCAAGKSHNPAFNPSKWVTLKLISSSDVGNRLCSFTFSLPSAQDYTGCLPGQYVQVRVRIGDRFHYRYLSPVSPPEEFGRIELVLRFETGVISKYFQQMKPGDTLEFCGPCGGFEYSNSSLEELTLLASGAGITPGMQLIRCILNNPQDNTKINLIYFSDAIADILYKEELDRYNNKDERLSITYTLGETPEGWDGEEGFIDTDMINRHMSKPNGKKHKVVMCGGPTMSVSCLHSLRSLGYPSEMIFIYGQFGTELVRSVYGRNIKLATHKC